MRVLGKLILDDFVENHSDVRSQAYAWLVEVERATWENTSDVKNRYSHASFLANNIVVFNLRGNKYRIAVKISYKNKILKIERIGTHAEYSKWTL